MESAGELLVRQTPAARTRRWPRRVGTALIVVGVIAIAYGLVIWLWRDPVTDLYNRWKQHQLAGQLEASFEGYSLPPELTLPAPTPAGTAPVTVPSVPRDDAPAPASSPAAEAAGAAAAEPAAPTAAELAAAVRTAARQYLNSLELGDPFAKIDIPRLGIDPVVVNGTRWGPDLTRGPGRYPEGVVPGLGKVTAVAGHRTTFGAPFRHIDDLQAGDEITLELPYGTFHYEVFEHEIVDSDDWSILDPRGFDTLVLSACHPLYSASQRWIVFAELVDVETPGGASYEVDELASSA